MLLRDTLTECIRRIIGRMHWPSTNHSSNAFGQFVFRANVSPTFDNTISRFSVLEQSLQSIVYICPPGSSFWSILIHSFIISPRIIHCFEKFATNFDGDWLVHFSRPQHQRSYFQSWIIIIHREHSMQAKCYWYLVTAECPNGRNSFYYSIFYSIPL